MRYMNLIPVDASWAAVVTRFYLLVGGFCQIKTCITFCWICCFACNDWQYNRV